MSPAELDRLIEEGLTLYGSGDLDGALLTWEKVLSEEPDNEQANSYVDYVRMNYDMLTSEPGEDPAPFGIAEDEPEYMIEISDGELPQLPGRGGTAPMYMDPTDAGWAIEEERVSSQPAATVSNVDDLDDADAPRPISIEMEADEPDEPPPKPTRAKTENFDDATREYEGPRRTTTRDFDGGPTGEFEPEGTPGFTTADMTELKKRDFGFVRTATPQAPSEPPPELKMTLRTPTDAIPPIPAPPPGESAFDISYAAFDDLPAGEYSPLLPIEPDDLIASLPSPTPSPLARELSRSPTKPPPPSRTTTDQQDPHRRRTAVQAAIDLIDLDLPDPTAEPPPAKAKTVPPPMAPMPANTFHSLVPPQPPRKPDSPPTQRHQTGDRPIPPNAPTRDLSMDALRSSFQHDPLVSAPTRELGLRPPTAPSTSRVPTEDQPTSINRLQPASVRAAAAARIADFDEPVDSGRQGTRADIVLPFDPIDARAAQIIDEVDAQAPDEENKEDRTRRRISTLLEHATLWASVDLDRAVAAVDLALNEDPNSALAQKLIHRNRDTIMNVFQAFLGDLERQPVLARPLHELAAAPISPRAAFLLSRVDGTLSLDEILDVSGMPRLEAYRYLCQLFLRGILR
ncbi:MAG TPA: hypothetical protein VGM90_27335 [Kofleriaceae bacterium]|jgi:hypothetical protein